MNELQIIDQRNVLGKEFRIYGDFENPLFLAKDVAEWIEHSDTSTMLRTVDESEKLNQTLFVSGQNREMAFLTEDGLYEVLMQSRKPIARQFKKEVKVILKSVRKNGMYAKDELLDNPDLLLDVVTRLKSEREQRLLLETKVQEDKPKVEFFDTVTGSKDTVDIGTAAKVLNLGIGRTKLFEILRNKGILQNNNIPYQKYIDSGYFRVIESSFLKPDGSKHVNFKTVVYQKGLHFITRAVSMPA